jgi:hypothetical protein
MVVFPNPLGEPEDPLEEVGQSENCGQPRVAATSFPTHELNTSQSSTRNGNMVYFPYSQQPMR